jgi:hypothetical protein
VISQEKQQCIIKINACWQTNSEFLTNIYKTLQLTKKETLNWKDDQISNFCPQMLFLQR